MPIACSSGQISFQGHRILLLVTHLGEKNFAIMAHQSAGGFPSGDPGNNGPLNKRSVPLSSEKGNQQQTGHPAHRSAQPNALIFVESPPGPAASLTYPPVNPGQNNTLPSPATAQWSSEAAITQASTTAAAAAEAESSPLVEYVPGADNDMSNDGSNETEFLNKALSAF